MKLDGNIQKFKFIFSYASLFRLVSLVTLPLLHLFYSCLLFPERSTVKLTSWHSKLKLEQQEK